MGDRGPGRQEAAPGSGGRSVDGLQGRWKPTDFDNRPVVMLRSIRVFATSVA